MGVVGSREFGDPALVRQFIAELPTDTVVISGGARGVDKIAAIEARARGLQVEEILADWSQGKSAGMLRNLQLVAECDAVTAFWDGQSRGTAHTIAHARRRGLPVTVIRERPSSER